MNKELAKLKAKRCYQMEELKTSEGFKAYIEALEEYKDTMIRNGAQEYQFVRGMQKAIDFLDLELGRTESYVKIARTEQ